MVQIDHGPTDGDALRVFLAERDAPCPVCGYNLRSVEGGHCPECGGRLTLTITDPHPLASRRGIMLLIFLWLLVAGSMNAVRAGRWINDALDSPQVLFVTARRGTVAPLSATADPGSTLTADEIRVVVPGPGAGPAPPVPGPPGVVTRSNVEWHHWTVLVGWILLAAIGLAGLVALARYRRRHPSPGVTRLLVLVAWSSLVAYFLCHAVFFVGGPA